MTLTIGSLFSGIGGIDLAFQNAGFDVAWQVEIDDFCQKVLAKHFPEAQRHTDIHECHNLPYVDVITAGFPCQPFSVAGLRKGADDERFLVPEMIRIINECQPQMVFLENVSGFASLNDGDEFKQLLRAFAEMGFDAQWGHPRASDTGAPHQRERWFAVLYPQSQRQQKGRELCQYPTQWASSTGQLPHATCNGTIPKEQQGQRDGIVSNSQNVPYTGSVRRGARRIHRSQILRRNRFRDTLQAIRKGCAIRNEFDAIRRVRSTTKLGNAQHIRSKRRSQRTTNQARCRKELFKRSSKNRGENKTIIARVDRVAHGLPTGLHRHRLAYDLTTHQFPAYRGQPQHDFEPPRVTARKHLRRDRIKALGNAVVPQVILPIAQKMYDYLTEAS